MRLFDGFSTCRRMLHVAESEVLSSFKKNYETVKLPTESEYLDFRQMWLHLVISDILNVKKKFGDDYGDIVITFDSKKSWRFRELKTYKHKRKEKQTEYDKFINTMFNNMLKDLYVILESANIMIIKDLYLEDTHGVEADDIIAVLVMNNTQDKHLIVSADSDFIQLLNIRVKQYSPMHGKLTETPSQKTIQMWKDVNIVSGQTKDSIPSIKTDTQLSPEFMKWVKEKYDLELDNSFIDKIELEHQDIMKEYIQLEHDKDLLDIGVGKRKRGRLLTPYVKWRWGDKKVLEFISDLENNLDMNPRYRANYERNKKILLFSKIPDDVTELILSNVPEKQSFLNSIELMNTLNKYYLYKLVDRIGEF